MVLHNSKVVNLQKKKKKKKSIVAKWNDFT